MIAIHVPPVAAAAPITLAATALLVVFWLTYRPWMGTMTRAV